MGVNQQFISDKKLAHNIPSTSSPVNGMNRQNVAQPLDVHNVVSSLENLIALYPETTEFVPN
jgi:hypothetical protein